MKQLPVAARVYVTAVIAVGLALLLVCLPLARFDQPLLFVALFILSTLSTVLKVSLPLTTGGSTMSVSYAVDLAALLLLGPHETMLIAVAGGLGQCNLRSRERNPPYRTLFSVAALVITVQGAGLAALALGGATSSMPLRALARPLVGVATTYFVLNTGLVAAAIGLSTRQGILSTWHNNFLWSAPSYFVGAGSAALAASFIEHAGYWIAPLMYAPIYLTYRSYKVYMGRIQDEHRHVQESSQTADLHLATLEAIAGAIDAKDQTTHMHIRRVQFYAAKLAKAVGLSEAEIQGVKTAALLHDIGKLAVPDHILTKPGPLTQEEFQKIRIHPQVGAEIVGEVPFPYPVAPLILCHHERWDGKGYPQGLAGDAIPIGARILTIVDYFDAVTSERPYHKALTPDSAVALLKTEAGRALDPKLLSTFFDLLPGLVEELGTRHRQPAMVALPSHAPLGSTAAGLVAAGSPTAFQTIALAHREVYALYEIAQAMGTSLGVSDTMALISSKLSKIVPWSGCALFLHQPETDSLKCRFATGIDVPLLLNASIQMGDELSGWVARNRRTLINGEPSATFRAAGIATPTALRAAIICPLQFNDTFIGCLALYHLETKHYTDDHRRLLERVAEQAGAVLHNSIVFEQMQEDSLTDPLTGLPNRRSMFVHLASELARADRLKTEVAVIVMDVDGFKQINDTFGHNVGDQALRAVATTLQGGLRPYDLCVRYAGDEFIVVIGGCSHDAADSKRWELQQRIGEIEIEVRAGERIHLSASAGAAVFPSDGATYETLLATADHRMYRDKHARRSQTASTRAEAFPPPPVVNIQPFEPAALRMAR
jgi:diguanylate cyclase (GGDEF)-like protein/putative nucleotidyltransferase with HDIG domain